MRVWQRYALIEMASIATVGIISAIGIALATPAIAIAYAITFLESIGMYGAAYALERRAGRTWQRALRTIALEFGPADLLDSVFFRPLCIYTGITLFGIGGAVAGKIVADIAFYGIAWTSMTVAQRVTSEN